jgi:hypothetical protein
MSVGSFGVQALSPRRNPFGQIKNSKATTEKKKKKKAQGIYHYTKIKKCISILDVSGIRSITRPIGGPPWACRGPALCIDCPLLELGNLDLLGRHPRPRPTTHHLSASAAASARHHHPAVVRRSSPASEEASLPADRLPVARRSLAYRPPAARRPPYRPTAAKITV